MCCFLSCSAAADALVAFCPTFICWAFPFQGIVLCCYHCLHCHYPYHRLPLFLPASTCQLSFLQFSSPIHFLSFWYNFSDLSHYAKHEGNSYHSVMVTLLCGTVKCYSHHNNSWFYHANIMHSGCSCSAYYDSQLT